MKQLRRIFLVIGSTAAFVSLLVFLAYALTGESSARSVEPTQNGKLTVIDPLYDFGTISMSDGSVSHTYRVRNDSNEPVALGNFYTSCMCTTAKASFSDGKELGVAHMKGHGATLRLRRVVEPGEEFLVEAIFDPNAHGPDAVGPVTRTVYIDTNSVQAPTIELAFEADVVR